MKKEMRIKKRIKKRRNKNRMRMKRTGPKNKRISKSSVRSTFERTTHSHSHTATVRALL
jgi:hypothetical protein